MKEENKIEKIERDTEVKYEGGFLENDRGLNALFTDNSPDKLTGFFRQLNENKINKYYSFYHDYNQQLEALELVNRYEKNLKIAPIAMGLVGLASLGIAYFFADDVLKILNNNKPILIGLIALAPMSFLNILNSSTLIFNFFNKQNNEEQ